MVFSKFVVFVLAGYFFYYLLLLAYDMIVSKKTPNEDEKIINFSNSNSETPYFVEDDDNFNDHIVNNENLFGTIEMQVESEGFPIDKLLKDGKALFAGLDF